MSYKKKGVGAGGVGDRQTTDLSGNRQALRQLKGVLIFTYFDLFSIIPRNIMIISQGALNPLITESDMSAI